MFIFSCSELVLQSTNGFAYATLVIVWACAPSTKAIPFFFSVSRRPTDPDFRIFLKKKNNAEGDFQTIVTLI